MESPPSKSDHRVVAAQQDLESKNHRLRAQLGASELAHQQVKPGEAAVATRREPTHQDIYHKIREVVGIGEAGGVFLGLRGGRDAGL
jgi:hypothetical protein